ncbi:MAG: hypothetical protein JW891_00280 [Candidatus Lokiarchaeota archaeon]|nr:hypothetical protein [Candidatus Lokiarchaeota archaeon]
MIKRYYKVLLHNGSDDITTASIDHDAITDNQEFNARGVYRKVRGPAAEKQGRDRRAAKDRAPENAGILI